MYRGRQIERAFGQSAISDNNDVEAVGIASTCRQCGIDVGKADRFVTKRRERLLVTQHAHLILVHEHDRLAVSHRQPGAIKRGCMLGDQRQPNIETAAVADFALHVHGALVFPDDLKGCYKPESVSGCPRGEERLEQPAHRGAVHADAAVGYGDADVVTGPHLSMAQQASLGCCVQLACDFDMSAGLRRMHCVLAQIEKRLLQLGLFAGHDGRCWRLANDEIDAGGH